MRMEDTYLSVLAHCELCPKQCGVNRLAGDRGFCTCGADCVVAHYGPHFGEEPPISGARGSGTVFFSPCNLRCVFCQNYQISQAESGEKVSTGQLADIFMDLERRGCHNINLVSPTPYAPQIAVAITRARRRGIAIPFLYNTNAYENRETIRMLDGLIDIYLPDLKYGDDAAARRYSHVRGYVGHARAAIAEMWRQVGPLELGADGLGRRGTIVRHLVLPNDLADSEPSLAWLREACGPDVTLSLMGQYTPAHKAAREALLSRTIRPREYARVIECAERLGIHDLLLQDEHLAPEFYRPDFERAHPFEKSDCQKK